MHPSFIVICDTAIIVPKVTDFNLTRPAFGAPLGVNTIVELFQDIYHQKNEVLRLLCGTVYFLCSATFIEHLSLIIKLAV